MHLLVESVCARLVLGAALSAPESGSDAVALGLRLLTPDMLKVITGCRRMITKGTESGNGVVVGQAWSASMSSPP